MHRKTPLVLIDRAGKAVWQAEIDPFWQVITEYNPNNLYQPIRMQGQHYDEESGLHYNRHRYYNAKMGRYITQDPIGLDGGLNIYQYPINPLQCIDPLGLFWDSGVNGVKTATNYMWEGVKVKTPVFRFLD